MPIEAVRGTEVQRQHERGAVAVEFALVFPIFILVVFGIINFGVLFSQQLALNNAVREGARAAVVFGNQASGTPAQQCKAINSRVQNASTALAMDPALVVVTVNRVLGSDGLTKAGTADQCTTPLADSSATPCKGSFNPLIQTNNSLRIEATYPAKYLVPFPPFPSGVTLKAATVYRCEWSSL